MRKLFKSRFIDEATEAKGFKFLASGRPHTQPLCVLHHSARCPSGDQLPGRISYSSSLCILYRNHNLNQNISLLHFCQTILMHWGAAAEESGTHARGQRHRDKQVYAAWLDSPLLLNDLCCKPGTLMESRHFVPPESFQLCNNQAIIKSG